MHYWLFVLLAILETRTTLHEPTCIERPRPSPAAAAALPLWQLHTYAALESILHMDMSVYDIPVREIG